MFIDELILYNLMEKYELKEIIIQQENISKEKIIDREIFVNLKSHFEDKSIIVLTGLRRVGKSTILNMIQENLNARFNYINFDDYRLIKFTTEDFVKLEEIFLELYGEQNYYFFDEIQNIQYWERFIRTLYDKGKKVFITGSNALMLSSELGTHLTGRNILITIYPFSFREFLKVNNFSIEKNDIYLMNKKAKLKNNFDNYLNTGGIAEYVIEKKTRLFEISL